jgi:hypothetical protein
MGPHSNDFYHSFLGHNLINQSMLDADAAGIGAREIADQFLEWRGRLKWVLLEQPKE